MKDGLITIGQAATILHRTPSTLRRWDRAGHTSAGQNFRAERRDAVTEMRYYRLTRILEIRDALLLAELPG